LIILKIAIIIIYSSNFSDEVNHIIYMSSDTWKTVGIVPESWLFWRYLFSRRKNV